MGFKNKGWQGMTVFGKGAARNSILKQELFKSANKSIQHITSIPPTEVCTQSTLLQITFLFCHSCYPNAICNLPAFRLGIIQLLCTLHFSCCLTQTTFVFNNLLNKELFVVVRYFIWNWKRKRLFLWKLNTTLQSMINAKISKHKFWHCHENRFIKTIQTIAHNLYVSLKSASLY